MPAGGATQLPPPAEAEDPLAIFPELASRLFATPVASVTLLEPTRQWFRVGVGLQTTETPIEHSFCRHAVERPDEVLYVPDATRDARFADNPLVTAPGGIRFYAGMPIRGAGGVPVGALCVIDHVPRLVEDGLLDRLRDLAQGVNAILQQEAVIDAASRREADGRMPMAMLAAVFQTVDAAVLVARPSGAILLFNAQCQDLLGYGAEELLGLRLPDIVAPEHRRALAEADLTRLQENTPLRLDAALLGRDGGRVPAQMSITLVQRREMPAFCVATLHRRHEGRAAPARKPIQTGAMGCIQFLGMQPVKLAYGPRWDAVRNRLLLAVEAILKRRLSPEDAYTRTDDDGFSIWFRNGSEEHNADQIARLRREVQTMLLAELGEETTGSVTAYTQPVEIDNPAAPQSEIMQHVSRRLAERRREAEQQARALLDRVMAEHPRESTPILGRSGAPIKAVFTDLPRRVRGRFSGAISLVGGPDADADAECLRLSLAADAVMEDLAEGLDRPHLVAVPITFFLSKRGRERFQAQWQAMPAKIGAQILVMLSDMPAQVSQSRLFDLIGMLRPITRGVGVMLEQVETLPFQPQSCSLAMVGLVSGALGSVSDAKLAALIQRLHQAKLPVLVDLAGEEASQRWYGLGADYTTTT